MKLGREAGAQPVAGAPQWELVWLRRAAVAATLSMVIVSCSPPARSFSALLARIDSSPTVVGEEVFLSAAALADDTEERLRLLKRAATRDPQLYAATASALVRASAISEPVALAALDAFLHARRFSEATGLFKGPLDPRSHPSEFAEMVVLADRYDALPELSTMDLVACADSTRDARFLVAAAVNAMQGGDRSTAATLLGDALRLSAESPLTPQDFTVPIELLWDSGALMAIADYLPESDDPFTVLVSADAALLLGRVAEASEKYSWLVRRFPTFSWKPYAMLARMDDSTSAAEGEIPPAWPLAPDPLSYAALSSPMAMAAYHYSAMSKHFPSEPGATLELARWRYRIGDVDEARSLAQSVGGEPGAIALLGFTEPERVVPEALRLVAMYPDSAGAYEAALEALAVAEAWDGYCALVSSARLAANGLFRFWFWEVLCDALSGRLEEAAAAVRRYGPDIAGFEGAYDLGLLELAAGHPGRAREDLALAINLADGVDERAKALILSGDAAMAQRDVEAARELYTAALGSASQSRVARSRLERIPGDD
ncbi:MAG: hypothetical protein JXM71_11480 [Spirochaetales bacterium]|nr:hypothetical protein [Spirochaetales bacterium]